MYSIKTVAVTPKEKHYKAHYEKYRRGKPRNEIWVSTPEKLERQRRAVHMQRVRALMLLGGKCETCGNNDMRVLEFDHINGNGRKERAIQAQVKQVFIRPSDFKILCANCHAIKHATSF